MTRVNIGVDPADLCDQHLLAEYRELPRVFSADPKGAPALPCLGRGHVKWCATKPVTMAERFGLIVDELERRGFRPQYRQAPPHAQPEGWTIEEVEAISVVACAIRNRIADRLRTMKRQPTWTNATRPKWAY